MTLSVLTAALSLKPFRLKGISSLLLAIALLVPTLLAATVAGNISGIVTDPHGLLVGGAKVTATELGTNFKQTTTTDAKGFYSLTGLPVGLYEISVDAVGFKQYHETNLNLNASGALLVNASLLVGSRTETITVSSSNVRVENVDTQLGEVIESFEATSVPLNGRSFTDLLALQPGIAPAPSFTSGSLQAAGASTISPSGNLNPGTISINGQREFANGFTVNGASVEEPFTMGAGVIPNLDSIAEFRILTSNVDAEYGNYSGGQISVVTKSGTNAYHGGLFEFVRNTALDARNFFSPERAAFTQNQYGGTFGGPILKNRLFFFGDYQGTQMTQGIDTGLLQVPSAQDRTGNLSDITSQLTGVVNGSYWANQLSQKLGYTVAAGEPYYTPGCSATNQCVFPGAVIPQQAWSAPGHNLLQYIPSPNLGGTSFSTSAQNQTLMDNKGGIRIDAITRIGKISGYYSIDDYALDNPYPTQQGGATVPGFNALTNGRAQLISLSDTMVFGAKTVNQLQASYLRDVNILGTPVGGVGTTLVSQGFVTADGSPSILPQRPAIEGVENVIFNNYTIGSTITGLNQFDNVFQYSDNLSHVIASHTLKIGGELLYNEVNASADVQSNGTFAFFGTETGSDFADFLIGVPSRYEQGDAQPFYMRNRYGALFAQDSWRVRPDLTFNYGIRWDVEMPFYEKFNQIQTIVPGQQSIVFPGAPTGLVFPTDPGIARSLAPTRWNNFSPRLGLAYSPGSYDGFLGKLLGKAGDSSIRAGFGRFFSAVEGISAGVMAGDAPYGSTYVSPAPPLFTNPFVNAATGFNNEQRFPLSFPPLNATAKNPNTTVNWAPFLPISGLPGYAPENVSPYSIQYNLSLQRQLGRDSVLTLNYIGSQGHHLLVLVEANPGDPALCLSISQVSQVAPGSATCGPFGETATYTTAAGQIINGTRGPLGSNFGSADYIRSIGNSNYNALEITFRHVSGRAQILAGYTFGKSMDISSSIADQVVPYDAHRTYGLSAYDVQQSFVASYTYHLPIDMLLRRENRLTGGWMISGIVRFSTGFPVTMTNSGDTSLLGTQPDGVNPFGVDLPQVQPGNLALNHNPRNGLPYFNTSLFGLPPLGQLGNTAPRYFFGPGIDNFDMALQKYVRLTEGSNLEFRLEAFNVFNHAQFFGPTAVIGDVNSAQFGTVTGADAPRLMQVAVKFSF
jgi:Carboxypeptidase regulatory-like domain